MEFWQGRKVFKATQRDICFKHRHDIIFKAYCLQEHNQQLYSLFGKAAKENEFPHLRWEKFIYLKKDIERKGLKTPLKARNLGGLYHVFDGSHRAAVALFTNLNSIPIVHFIGHNKKHTAENMFCYSTDKQTEVSDLFLSNSRNKEKDLNLHFGQLFKYIDKDSVKKALTFYGF